MMDPLEDPDPAAVGAAAAVETLLRCYVRETGVAVPADGPLRLNLHGLELTVPVLYRSPTGWHRFGRPSFPALGDIFGAIAPKMSPKPGAVGVEAADADAGVVVAALVREATVLLGLPPHAGIDAVARVLNSAQRVAVHVADRRAIPDDPAGTSPFLAAEQGLLLGHPFHPTAKSREGASEAELAAYSPELRGGFPLHWFAAHPSVVAQGSADGRPPDVPAPDLPLPDGWTAIPAHSWQARDVLVRPGIQALLGKGLLHDLGQAGPDWYPTSSVRTVYRPDADVMLKLSLGLRITNSRRNNLRSELALGVRIAQLLDAGLAGTLASEHPAFGIVRDPAWISVDVPDCPESGLETAIRANPFGPADRVACVSGLVAERPGLGPSRLAELVHGIAGRGGRPLGTVSAEWFARYLRVLLAPLIWLYTSHGLALEAHQQNTLVRLDAEGWPVGAWYRDSQGYYVRESHVDTMGVLLPGFADEVPIVFGDELTDERVVYYLIVNNLFGLIGAFGAQGLADEAVLLALLREALTTGPTARVVELLLDAPTLPCKANYLTCVDGRDELVGDVASQSVYVQIPNPLNGAYR